MPSLKCLTTAGGNHETKKNDSSCVQSRDSTQELKLEKVGPIFSSCNPIPSWPSKDKVVHL